MDFALSHGPSRPRSSAPHMGLFSLRATPVTLREPSTPLEFTDALGDALAGRDIKPGDHLTYALYPECEGDESFSATCIALDIVTASGSRLSDTLSRDQYGFISSSSAYAASKLLVPDQWNHLRVSLDALAGEKIARLELAYVPLIEEGTGETGQPSDPESQTAPRAWVDVQAIAPAPPLPDPADLLAWVDTRRGTHSSGDFSRGSTIPITALPNAMAFWIPATRKDQRWPYEYHAGNTPENASTFAGIALSQAPSPWMGDRNQLYVTPLFGEGEYTFRHEDEQAGPHRYAVRLQCGGEVAVLPTMRGALIETTWPREGERAFEIDLVDAAHGIEEKDGWVTGWVENGANDGRVPTWFALCSDGEVVGLERSARLEHGYVLRVRGEGAERLRIATSFLGAEQARRNLELELRGLSPAEVEERAAAAWRERLGVIEVSGASDFQRRTLYSNLYRLNLYPNATHENVGSAEEPRWVHASCVQGLDHSQTPPAAPVHPGKAYVNNGFWDTYRTVWPALSLLYPQLTAELIDGMVQQFREGGWMARWSSPGYADLMTGTSSDVAFADAEARGVRLLDPETTLLAGLKNSTVASPRPEVGRKGLSRSQYLGFTPADMHESVSWGLEGFINDWGLAQQARAHGLEDLAEYLEARSANAALAFDPETGFFRAQTPQGDFTVPAAEFDPCVWGGEFTETDGWNFAFTAPHLPRTLAALHGGPEGLRAKLNAFFSTQETAEKYGSYGFSIHEMIEARAVRMGQFGFSNQPAHHIAHTALYARDPYAAQERVHETLRRLFTGDEIGQGYPGDEDNGEMSAWWILSALGLYPLRVGAGEWALTTPLFEHARVRPLGGPGFEIQAQGWSESSVYASRLEVVSSGGASRTVRSPFLRHEDLAGATLRFTVHEEWPEILCGFDGLLTDRPVPALADAAANGAASFPEREESGDVRVLVDRIRDVRVEIPLLGDGGPTYRVPQLFDNYAATSGAIVEGGIVRLVLEEDSRPEFVTVTSGPRIEQAPKRVTVTGIRANGTATTLAAHAPLDFRWPHQLIPVRLPEAKDEGPLTALLLDFHTEAPIEIAEVEALERCPLD